MEGKLKKLSTGWVVEYKMDSDLIATDGGQIPINPYLEKYYFLDEDDEGSEVYFEMENLWETGFEEVLIVANLVRRPNSSSKIVELRDDINLEEVSKEQLEQERNTEYKYFNLDGYEQVDQDNPVTRGSTALVKKTSVKYYTNEISDEEIEKESEKFTNIGNRRKYWQDGAKWYKEQLKNK